jgi:RecA/RadA recombinase
MSGRPFDISRFRKSITKSIPGMSVGFSNPKTWISTGNYALNYLISGNFYNGVPLSKVTVFAGASGSGKSYIVSGNIIKNAQEQGIFVILIDSENALDKDWVAPLGVDTSDDKILKLNLGMINDVAKVLSDFFNNYKELPEEDRPKVLFVIDSLGMLMAPTQVEQFEKGDLKGDMGIKAKQLKALVQNCINAMGGLEIGIVATNHIYENQDAYATDDIVAGGLGFIFASSIVIAMKQMKLKEDEDGAKIKEVRGIRAGCKILKSRFNKPFESTEIQIPWDGGLDPFSGLFDLFLEKGLLVKEGNRYTYDSISGTQYKLWKKDYNKNKDGIMDLIMQEFDTQSKKLQLTHNLTVDEQALVDKLDEIVDSIDKISE